MAQSKALEVWNGLPNWAKGIIAVGGLAIIYFTANSVIKSIKKSESWKRRVPSKWYQMLN